MNTPIPHRKLRRARRELTILILLATVSSWVIWQFDIDLKLADWFYRPGEPHGPWPLHRWGIVKLLYDFAFPFTVIAGLSALTICIVGHFYEYTRRFRRRALYILLVILLGPGVLVNLIVKDHWGRPRPVHTLEFGGKEDFVPAGRIGSSEGKSFVCGHCSVGYAFFVLYFLSQNHKVLYFLMTLALALTMGFTRMAAGGHYLSDILWSGYLVFLVAYVLYYGWFIEVPLFRKPKPETLPAERSSASVK